RGQGRGGLCVSPSAAPRRPRCLLPSATRPKSASSRPWPPCCWRPATAVNHPHPAHQLRQSARSSPKTGRPREKPRGPRLCAAAPAFNKKNPCLTMVSHNTRGKPGGADFLSAAEALARRGWKIFPLYDVREGACSCGDRDCKSPGKHPRTANGLKDGTADVAA